MSSDRTWFSSLWQAWRESIDLLAVVAVVVLTNLLVFRLDVGEPVVQAVLGLVFVMFVPGYALVSALFPEAEPSTAAGGRSETATDRFFGLGRTREIGRVSGVERVALSFGLSIALVPLVVFGLTFLPIELARLSVFLTISAITVGCAGAAAIRRHRLSQERRFRVPYRAWLVAGKRSVTDADSRFEGALNFALAVAVVLAVVTLAFAVVSPPDAEHFTDFHVLTENESGALTAADYPETLSADPSRTVHLGIENHEHEPLEYTVVVQLTRLGGDANGSVVTDRAEIDRFSTTLGHDETSIREQTLPVVGGPTGERLRLLFLLYVGEVPETPTRDNAYRDLHLWVEREDEGPEVDEPDPSHVVPGKNDARPNDARAPEGRFG